MSDLKNKLANKAAGTGTEVKKVSPNKAMEQLMVKMSDQIKKALPQHMSSDRFQRVALTAFGSNPNFLNCEPMSFLAAMMDSAQLGLEPNTPLGQAYLIPYGNKVQFQVGYKGLLELALRSGKIKSLYAHEVRENDKFEVKYGLHQDLVHEPVLKGERGDVIGYYAVYHLDTGGHSFVFMTRDEVLAHAKGKSKTFNKGPWQTDFDAMAKKTVIKQLLKYAPLSIEMQRAVSSDETVKSKIDEDMSLVVDETESIEANYEIKEEEDGQSSIDVK